MLDMNFNKLINTNLSPYIKVYLKANGDNPKKLGLSEKELARIDAGIFSWSCNTLEDVLDKMNLKIADAIYGAPSNLSYPFWDTNVGYNNLRWNVRVSLNLYANDHNLTHAQLISEIVNTGIKQDIAEEIWEGERNIRNYENDRLADLFGDYEFLLENDDNDEQYEQIL